MELIRALVENQSQMVATEVSRKVIRRDRIMLKADVGKGKLLTFETKLTADDRKEGLELGCMLFNQTLERYRMYYLTLVTWQQNWGAIEYVR